MSHEMVAMAPEDALVPDAPRQQHEVTARLTTKASRCYTTWRKDGLEVVTPICRARAGASGR